MATRNKTASRDNAPILEGNDGAIEPGSIVIGDDQILSVFRRLERRQDSGHRAPSCRRVFVAM
jgi:hypothetical protein